MNRCLQELTKKLETIKESWQIYEIFEEEKKRFKEEYQSLQKDKEDLIKTLNENSAKNALLNANNESLEIKNKELETLIAEKTQELQQIKRSIQAPKLSHKIDFSTLNTQVSKLKNLLPTTKPHLPSRPIALEKLEIIYQKHQKLLANPAKPYVTLKEAIHLYDLLQFLLDRFQLIMPEYEKLITILDELQFTINSAQKESIQKNTTKDSALEISEIMQDLEESLSHS